MEAKYKAAKKEFDSESKYITNGYNLSVNEEDVKFKFVYEINIDSSRLWNLFWDIGNALFEEFDNIYCIYGLKDEEMELTDYKDKSYIKKILEKYKYSIVNDGFLSVGIAFDKDIIEEVFIESFKYLRVFTSQKEKIQSVLAMYNLHEKQDLRFIDEFFVCSETVADAENGVLHPDDIVKKLDKAFNESEKVVQGKEQYVQSYISNISFAKSIDEIISRYENYSEYTTLDPIFNEDCVEWTAPKWAKNDDIVFFMFSKTSIDTIHHLNKFFESNINEYSSDVQKTIKTSLAHGEELYESYGGCIFAVGRINGTLLNDDFAVENNFHWQGRIYAPIGEIIILEKPIHISEFNSFILISRQSSITPLFGDNFEQLKNLILKNNKIGYLINAHSSPVPLAKINSDNWFSVANQYRRSFFLEYQFRVFFVDYLLPLLSDDKRFYEECSCVKDNQPVTFVDNVILFNSKYLPVEIKLNINAEKDLQKQCRQYCSLKKLFLKKNNEKQVDKNEIYANNVLIIDTNGIYIFSESINKINKILDFDNLESVDAIGDLKDEILLFLKFD